MRLTPTMQQRSFLDNINQLRTRQGKAQEQVSTGKSVNRLSDNPFAAGQASQITSAMSANDQFTDSNGQLRSQLELTDLVLQSMNSSLDTAKGLAAQALAGTNSPDTMQSLASALDGVREQLLSSSNAQFNGTYLFAGTNNKTQPFVESGGTVTYQGNDEDIYQRLDRSSVIKTNITGQDLFVNSPSPFTVLDNLKTAILNNDTAAIKSGLDDLETIATRVNSMDAIVGNSMQLVDQTQTSLKNENQSLQERISDLTDANLVESISDLNLTNQALNVSLSAQAQMQQLSLLDYLR